MLVQSDHFRSDKVSNHQFDHLNHHQNIVSTAQEASDSIMATAATTNETINNNGDSNMIPAPASMATLNQNSDEFIDKSVVATIDQLLARIVSIESSVKKILANHNDEPKHIEVDHNKLNYKRSQEPIQDQIQLDTDEITCSNQGEVAMRVQDDCKGHLSIDDDKLMSPGTNKFELESNQEAELDQENRDQPKFHELVPSPIKKQSQQDDAQETAAKQSDDLQVEPVHDITSTTATPTSSQETNKLPEQPLTTQKKTTSTRTRVKQEQSKAGSNDEEQQSRVRARRQRVQTKLFQIADTPGKSNKRNREEFLSSEASATSQDESSPVKRPRKSTSTATGATRSGSGRKRKGSNSTTANKARKSPLESQSASSQDTEELSTFLKFVDSHFIKDVIHYDKNDFLAIRNEENTFYLAQLAETVRSAKPNMKVRWLDTEDNGKTYFLTNQYDQIPQKSIIMPVELNKLKSDKKHSYYAMDDEVKENVLDRLSKSIIVSNDKDSSGSQL